MRSIQPVAAVAAFALAVLTTGCEKPNLNDTGGGYGPRATSSPEADTGSIAPHEGPAPSDTPGAATEH